MAWSCLSILDLGLLAGEMVGSWEENLLLAYRLCWTAIVKRCLFVTIETESHILRFDKWSLGFF